MTVCPIAVVAGCAKCPVEKVCLLKGVLGDYKKPEPPAPEKSAAESRAKK